MALPVKSALRDILARVYYEGQGRNMPGKGNRILLYHSVGLKLSHDTYGISIPMNTFKAHMAFIAARYRATPLPEEGRDMESLVKDNTLTISFDDGYEDNRDAAQVLAGLGLPFIIYVTAGFIGKKGYLRESHLRELASWKDCRIGTHGMTHRKLGTLAPQEQEEELRSSKMLLEDLTGRPVVHLSYPHGSYTALTMELAQRTGYALAASSDWGMNRPDNTVLYALKRTEVLGSDDTAVLERKIKGWYDYLALKQSLARRLKRWKSPS